MYLALNFTLLGGCFQPSTSLFMVPVQPIIIVDILVHSELFTLLAALLHVSNVAHIDFC